MNTKRQYRPVLDSADIDLIESALAANIESALDAATNEPEYAHEALLLRARAGELITRFVKMRDRTFGPSDTPVEGQVEAFEEGNDEDTNVAPEDDEVDEEPTSIPTFDTMAGGEDIPDEDEA